jgi:hypothetical protein
MASAAAAGPHVVTDVAGKHALLGALIHGIQRCFGVLLLERVCLLLLLHGWRRLRLCRLLPACTYMALLELASREGHVRCRHGFVGTPAASPPGRQNSAVMLLSCCEVSGESGDPSGPATGKLSCAKASRAVCGQGTQK